MGFLNKTTVTVAAILTKKGRELLAQGTEAFNITKFALADDEIDYNLFDVTHPNGSDSYGKVIENMPLLEAIPDENHVMRYKLVTLPRTTSQMPQITVAPESVNFPSSGRLTQARQLVAPDTNLALDNSYTFILHNDAVAMIYEEESAADGIATSVPFFLGLDDAPSSMSVVAKTIKVGLPGAQGAVAINNVASTQITIVGNDTGATTSVTVTNNVTVASLMSA